MVADTIEAAMLLYYITDRTQLGATEAERRRALRRRVAEAASAGVDYIQLREKDMSARELEQLACEILDIVRAHSTDTKLLINSRADVAIECGADGVHVPSDGLPASEIRTLWMKRMARAPVIGVSAHSVAEVRAAEAHGADFAVLAPIFGKSQVGGKGIGLSTLQQACSGLIQSGCAEGPGSPSFPVVALGGVTLSNAAGCLAAGAAGVAGIRLFQQGDITATVRHLRDLRPAAAK